MFGISKKEIEAKIADKIIEALKDKGYIYLAHIGTLRWTAGSDQVRFEQDPELLKELQLK